MTTYTATPSNIAAIWSEIKASDGGHTLKLDGKFPYWRPKGKLFTEPVTIDARAAEIFGCYVGGQIGNIDVFGGLWHGELGFRADAPKRIGIYEIETIGTNLTRGVGVWLIKGEDIRVESCKHSGTKIGQAINGKRIITRYHKLFDLGSDGIDLFGAQDFLVDWIDVAPFKVQAGMHADVIQLDSPGTGLKTANGVIRRVRAKGAFQGINGFDHTDTGDQGYENITIADCQLELTGYLHGIHISNCNGLSLLRNRITTLPGSPYQAQITGANNSNVLRSGNFIGGHKTPAGRVYKPIIDPDYVPGPVDDLL